MSTISCSEKQHPNTAAFRYCGPLGSFASPNGRPLANDPFGHVLGFLGPKDLARAERVCHSWNQFIDATDQWKKLCQRRLNIPTKMDPRTFLPKKCASYKEGAQLASTITKVFDARIYRYYLGAEIELPPILKEAPLEKSNEPDPCDPTQTKGQNYVWMDSPSYFKMPGDCPFELDKPDNPNDDEAPKLKKISLIERIKRKIGLGSKLKKRVLKVPNTINNLGVLFKYPKNGNPSTYEYVLEAISDQCGNKRIPPGRICMREDVVLGSNRTFAYQQAVATKKGIIIPQLGHRILFDFLRHVETNTYPDGQNPLTFTRTATLIVDSQGTSWPLGCGCGGPSGLDVNISVFDNDFVAVALPAE